MDSYLSRLSAGSAETASAPPTESFLSKLGNYAIHDSIPAKMAKSFLSGLTLPGDVYAGKVDPMSQEGMDRAGDFAGMITLGAGAVPAGANELGMGIRAFHGSPHDFDKFSMSKLGSGEGAQGFGHGLYFAENENIAKGYRDALSEPDGGKMYQVDINAEPSRMLDWDKSVKDQTPEVQNALTNLIPSTATGKGTYALDPEMMPRDALNQMGADIQRMENLPRGNEQKYAADELKAAGIPGIKYFDSGSRAVGTGSRNYVVFDDKLIDIVKKYGITGAVTAGLLTAAQAAAMTNDPNASFADAMASGNAT